MEQKELIPKHLLDVKTKADLARLYDALFEAGKRIFEKHDICEHEPTGKTGKTNTYGVKKARTINLCACTRNRLYKSDAGFCCCGGCTYLAKSGCRVKCLECKLFVCGCWPKRIKKKTVMKIKGQLQYLRRIAYQYNLLHMRTSKTYALKRSWESRGGWMS